MKAATLKARQELKEELERKAKRRALQELKAKFRRESAKDWRTAQKMAARRLERLKKEARKTKARKRKEKKPPPVYDPISSSYRHDARRYPDPRNWVGNRK